MDIPLDALRAELSSHHDRELEEVRQQHCSEVDRHRKQLQDLLEQRKKEVRFCHYSKSPPPSNIASTFHVVRCTPVPMFSPVTASTGNYCGGGHMKDQHKVEECNNAFRATPLFQSAHKHTPVYPGQIHQLTYKYHATALLVKDLLQHCTVLCLASLVGTRLMPSLYCQSVTIK